MPRPAGTGCGFPDAMELLDDLIQRCYDGLKERAKSDAKLGDLLKMIELRRKLEPGDSDRQQFWNMLERIRREELKREKKAASTASARRGNQSTGDDDK